MDECLACGAPLQEWDGECPNDCTESDDYYALSDMAGDWDEDGLPIWDD